jgi:Fe-S cluster assembly protein SufB
MTQLDTSTSPHIFDGLSRELFDGRDNITYTTLSEPGITEAVVRQISANNNEPQWMLDFRLKSLEIFHSKSIPGW